jgi:hypothetical protein
MTIVKLFGGLLFLFLIYKIRKPKLEPASTEVEAPDKIEAPVPIAATLDLEADLELAAFRADLEAFGKDKSQEIIPTGAIFRHPLANIQVDQLGFGRLNTYAYSSLLINDAYLHPLISNEQRESARAFLRSVIGEDTFAIMHPQLINRQVAPILQTCTLVSTVLQSRQAD